MRAMWPLLERVEEMRAIAELVGDATTGRGRVLVIEGAAGAGKTALVRHARAEATSAGLRTLDATGSELEKAFPFGIARQLLERPMAELADTAAGSTAVPAGAAAALGTAPGLPIQAPAAVHGLYRLVGELAAREPLVLTVDDAHWADVASLGFLHYLARRIGEAPVALVLALRPLTAPPPPAMLTSLLADEETLVVRLNPLSPTALAELVRGELSAEPDPTFVDACARATGGNPYLATELLRELARRDTAPSGPAAHELSAVAPDTIRRRVAGWLSTMGDAATRVARSLAILGQAPLPLVAEHAGVEIDAVRAACLELEGVGLLDDSTVLRFTHPLLQHAVISTMSAGERSEGHRRAAELQAAARAPAEVCALHVLQSRPAASPWSASILHRAAAVASERGAPDEAAGFLQRALAEPAPEDARPELLLELGAAQLRIRRLAEATQSLESGLKDHAAPEVRARLAIALAQSHFLAGDHERAVDVLETARAEERDAERRMAIDGNAISLGLVDPRHREGMRSRLAEYRLRATRGEITEPVILALTGAASILNGDPGESGVALVRRAFDAGLSAFDEHAFAFGWAICALDAADLSQEAMVHLDAALRRARPLGDAAATAYVLSYRTHAAMRVGRLAEAEADGRVVLDIIDRVAGDISFPVGMLDVLVERGLAEEAWGLWEEQTFRGSSQRSAMLRLVGARVAIATGREDGVLATLLEVGAEIDEMGFTHPQFAPWRALAIPLAARHGPQGMAARLADELVALAERTGAPTAIAQALHIRGALHDDVEELEASVRAAQATPDLLEYARSLTALGVAQHRRGAAAAARESLRLALSTAHEAGAVMLAGAARKALIAAGGRPRRPALRGIDALTPAEVEVARMAAQGLANRDISDTLFVAVKTVEQHLARVYAKLQISGRGELGGALAAPTQRIAAPTER